MFTLVFPLNISFSSYASEEDQEIPPARFFWFEIEVYVPDAQLIPFSSRILESHLRGRGGQWIQ